LLISSQPVLPSQQSGRSTVQTRLNTPGLVRLFSSIAANVEWISNIKTSFSQTPRRAGSMDALMSHLLPSRRSHAHTGAVPSATTALSLLLVQSAAAESDGWRFLSYN
jgi:hypothetical protein